jgi:NAD(P)-dependent dehydrogenase (short-subunit alcohol dehydrogenase family)
LEFEMGQLTSQKVVVITGASGGVGRATARAFAARGDRVALMARGTRRLSAAASEIEGGGGTCMTVPVDVADQGALEAAADRVEATLGDIDVWVNVAFTSVFARFMDISAEEFERVTDVNYHGFVNGTRSALARMLPRDRGTVVQVGSTLAYRGIPLQSAYSGSKHAHQGFHESLRTELMHDRSNVRVTIVQMPAANTPQFSRVLSRLPDRRSWFRRSTSRRSPQRPSFMRPIIPGAASTGLVSARWGRWWPTQSLPGSWTATWPGQGSARSRPKLRADPTNR